MLHLEIQNYLRLVVVEVHFGKNFTVVLFILIIFTAIQAQEVGTSSHSQFILTR